jgi:hypothetical protein
MPARGIDRTRAVEIRPGAGGFGTGYRIGGRLVLTCAHLFPAGPRSTGRVRARDLDGRTAWEVDGIVRWSAYDGRGTPPPQRDVALVELPEATATVEPVAFGFLPPRTGNATVAFELYGYPRWAWTERKGGGVETGGRLVSGTIYLADLSADEILPIDAGRTGGAPAASNASAWLGLSGAAVLCNGLVVAVQRHHQNPRRPEALEAVPLRPFYDEPAFRERLAEHDIPLAPTDASRAAPIEPERIETLRRRLEAEFAQRSDPIDAISVEVALTGHLALRVRDPHRQRPDEGVALEELATPGARILLSGGSGSGKTTTLLHLAVQAVRSAALTPAAPIPLYGRLPAFDTATGGFAEVVALVANACGLRPAEVDALWRQEDQPVVFLLDGLNEVDRRYRDRCVATLSEAFIQGPNTFVVASRPCGEADMLARDAKLQVVELLPVDESDVARRLGDADRLDPDLRRLLEVPFLLWAYARASSSHEAAHNRGQMYRQLVDDSLFGLREARPGLAAYDYELVKKPVLGWLAARMTADGQTQVERSTHLSRAILERLDELDKDRRIMASGEAAFMPEPPNAADFLGEVVRSGVLRVVGTKLEFGPHQSVQDYFTAVSLVGHPPETVIAPVPVLDWRTLAQYDAASRSFVMRHRAGPLLDALIMLCGIVPDAGELVRRLTPVDPVTAGACLAEATSVDARVRSDLRDTCRDLLAAFHPHKRWIGATAAGLARMDDVAIVARLVSLMMSDPDWPVREAAYRALDTVDPTEQRTQDFASAFVDDLLSRFGQIKTPTGQLLPTLEETLEAMLGDHVAWPWEVVLEAADTNPSVHVRTAAGLALRLRVADEHARLLDMLESGEPAARVLAARVLAGGRDDAAIPALVTAASASDGRVRLAALQALVRMRSDEALPLLTGRLGVLVETDSEPDLRNGIDALKMLAAAGLDCSDAALQSLVELTKHAPFAAVRAHAFDVVRGIPGGRDRLMNPIHERLQQGDYQGVIDEIGADEPFVASPNLVLWRAFAFEAVGDRSRAIEDAQRFIATAAEPGAAGFAFLAGLFRDSGQHRRLADLRALAAGRLANDEVEEFERLLGPDATTVVAAESERLDVLLVCDARDASVAAQLADQLGKSGVTALQPLPGKLPDRAMAERVANVALLSGAGRLDESVLALVAERRSRDPLVRVIGVLLPHTPLDPYTAAGSLPITNVVDMRIGHDDPIACQNLVAVLRGRREPFDVGPISERLEHVGRELPGAMSAFALARRLLESSGELGTEPPSALRSRPVETWLLEVRRLFDRSLVARLDERHALIGLATLDPTLRHELSDRLDRLRAEIGEIEPLLTPFARAVLASQERGS